MVTPLARVIGNATVGVLLTVYILFLMPFFDWRIFAIGYLVFFFIYTCMIFLKWGRTVRKYGMYPMLDLTIQCNEYVDQTHALVLDRMNVQEMDGNFTLVRFVEPLMFWIPARVPAGAAEESHLVSLNAALIQTPRPYEQTFMFKNRSMNIDGYAVHVHVASGLLLYVNEKIDTGDGHVGVFVALENGEFLPRLKQARTEAGDLIQRYREQQQQLQVEHAELASDARKMELIDVAASLGEAQIDQAMQSLRLYTGIKHGHDVNQLPKVAVPELAQPAQPKLDPSMTMKELATLCDTYFKNWDSIQKTVEDGINKLVNRPEKHGVDVCSRCSLEKPGVEMVTWHAVTGGSSHDRICAACARELEQDAKEA